MAVTTSVVHEVVAPLRRRPWLTVLVAVLCAVPYGVGLALPYYANGIHRRPAGEPIYAHDLATLWPYDTALGGAVAFVTIVGLPLAPFVATAVAMWAGFSVWDGWRSMTRTQVALYLVAIAVVVATFVLVVRTHGGELVVWFLD